RVGGTSGGLFLRRRRGDDAPELVAASERLGRIGEQPFAAEVSSERAQGVAQLVAAEAIALGGDDGIRPAGLVQELQQVAIALLSRNADVNQCNAQREFAALLQIRLDKFGPFSGDGAWQARVAVAGQIGEQQVRARLAGTANLEKINGAGTAGGRAGARYLFADQRVQHA